MQVPGRCCHWASLPSPSVWEAASMYGTAVAVFLVILVAALQGSAPTESRLPYHIPLDPEGFLELSWNVSYAQEAIDFQLLVRRLKAGVLFGMSDRGKPENADLVVLWTDGDTAYFAIDMLSTVPDCPAQITDPAIPGNGTTYRGRIHHTDSCHPTPNTCVSTDPTTPGPINNAQYHVPRAHMPTDMGQVVAHGRAQLDT
ncbi:hypothetical protein P7K49_001942 [Saguinus oedipus]|uniref:DOMON domain-containing protein n=1 Tax=Saguinus oedipus TaxID=9490 RepID=A0ABQ9WFY5_SAGOE|nr:hypothetical protein P7K49_001942 [Saguinus oedipus]